MRVHGVSMHYYNEGANSDKYYRAMYWQDGATGQWTVAYHWGRDGSAGQSKIIKVANYRAAWGLVERKVKEQTGPKKNYQHLGEGYVDVTGPITIEQMGLILHSLVGRPPLKLPTGMDYLIREEDDVEDLLACLSG